MPPGIYARPPMEERFWSKVERPAGTDACWKWRGSTVRGYGHFYRGGGREAAVYVNAHRVSYELLVGPIPDGLQLDHLCRNRACVNPAHLEPVTARENTLRGTSLSARRARQTHCRNSHEFTAATTYVDPKGRRVCRPCRAKWHRTRRALS